MQRRQHGKERKTLDHGGELLASRLHFAGVGGGGRAPGGGGDVGGGGGGANLLLHGGVATSGSGLRAGGRGTALALHLRGGHRHLEMAALGPWP